MLTEADGVVETITPGGYVDHFDSGQVAIFDVMSMAVTSPAGNARLRVVLDAQPPAGVEWRPGLRVRFQIEDHLIGTHEPVYSATLRDVRVVGEQG